MAANYQDGQETVAEENMLIREHQRKMAYAFPVHYAPNGRLRETSMSHYMAAMRLYYQYNKSLEDLTLELRQDSETGTSRKYATVGTVYSADFFWNELETIRLHLVAVRKNNSYAVVHYNVFDMGASGNAYSIPGEAWDNWMAWAHEKVEGVAIDKRLLFLALGDRSQIGNMDLEAFSKLKCDQVERLQDNLKPGMMLVRPSIQEAGLEGSPRDQADTPLVELSSSSSSSDDQPKPKRSGREPKIPKLGGRSTLERPPFMKKGFGRGSTHSKAKKTPAMGSAMGSAMGPWWMNYHQAQNPPNELVELANDGSWVHLGPDGEPLRRDQVEGMKNIFKECFERNEEGGKDKESTKDDAAQSETNIKTIDDTSGEEGSSNDFEMSGISSLCETSARVESSLRNSSADWDGPVPMNDSVEVFLAKRLESHEVVNVSTDSSVLDVSRGQSNDPTVKEL